MRTLKIALITLLLSLSAAAYSDATRDFESLLDEHWEWTLKSYPLFASSLGDRRFNDQWTDQSMDAIEQRHKDTREFLRRVYAIDRNALSDSNQLNYELFRRQLQEDVDMHKFNGHLMPFFHRGGVQDLENTTNQLRL